MPAAVRTSSPSSRPASAAATRPRPRSTGRAPRSRRCGPVRRRASRRCSTPRQPRSRPRRVLRRSPDRACGSPSTTPRAGRPGDTRPGGLGPDDLVVHQQDVQAVVNALWRGRRRRRAGHGPAADRHERGPLRRQHPDPGGARLLPAVRRSPRSATRRSCSQALDQPSPTCSSSATTSRSPASAYDERRLAEVTLPAGARRLPDLTHAEAQPGERRPYGACARHGRGPHHRSACVVLLFCVYQLVWTNVTANAHEADARSQLEDQWQRPSGRAVARRVRPPAAASRSRRATLRDHVHPEPGQALGQGRSSRVSTLDDLQGHDRPLPRVCSCPARSATSRSPATAPPTASRCATSRSSRSATRSTSRPRTPGTSTRIRSTEIVAPTDVQVVLPGAEAARREADGGPPHDHDVQPALGVLRALDHLRRAERDPARRPTARRPSSC